MPINETFHGFIETTADTLLIFEACRRGILPRISRRLQERERGAVKSGTIFVFDEKESGIKRWTDGLIWSPSRILGNFLVYRELDGRESLHKNEYPCTYDKSLHLMEETMSIEDRNKERALVGSLTDTYKFKRGGLIKKTLSINLNGSAQHLISYYTKEDVFNGRLVTPSSVPEIASLQIIPDLLSRQSFRVPPSLEYTPQKRLSLSPSSTTSSVSSHSKKKHYHSQHEQYQSRYRIPDVFDSSLWTIPKKPNRMIAGPLVQTPHQVGYSLPPDDVYSKYQNTPELWASSYDPITEPREFPDRRPLDASDRKYTTASLPSPNDMIWPAVSYTRDSSLTQCSHFTTKPSRISPPLQPSCDPYMKPDRKIQEPYPVDYLYHSSKPTDPKSISHSYY